VSSPSSPSRSSLLYPYHRLDREQTDREPKPQFRIRQFRIRQFRIRQFRIRQFRILGVRMKWPFRCERRDSAVSIAEMLSFNQRRMAWQESVWTKRSNFLDNLSGGTAHNEQCKLIIACSVCLQSGPSPSSPFPLSPESHTGEPHLHGQGCLCAKRMVPCRP
jgi:hypothetical protein